jgi:hypothetical protein
MSTFTPEDLSHEMITSDLQYGHICGLLLGACGLEEEINKMALELLLFVAEVFVRLKLIWTDFSNHGRYKSSLIPDHFMMSWKPLASLLEMEG